MIQGHQIPNSTSVDALLVVLWTSIYSSYHPNMKADKMLALVTCSQLGGVKTIAIP